MKMTAEAPRFNFTTTSIQSIYDEEERTFLASVDAIEKIGKEQVTQGNTLSALEGAAARLSNSVNTPLFLKYVSTDAAIRDVADKCETRMQQLMVDLFARKPLYQRLKWLEETMAVKDPVDAKLLTEYLVLFERNGLGLSDEQRKTFLEKKKRLVTLESEFSKRLVEWEDHIEVTEEELKGLSPSYRDSLKKTDDGQRYKVTLSYPHYNAFMENAESDAARERLESKYMQRGGPENVKLITEALILRRELANLLGFESHADFVLSRRMAKSAASVHEFLKRLKGKLLAKGKAELDELHEIKKRARGADAPKVTSYEWRFWENQLRKERYQLDNQAIKEYFPMPTVIDGMFQIYQRLLGVEFVAEKGLVWHPSVELFRIDKKGETVAYFFMDLFPRDGKYGHAAAFTLVSGHQTPEGKYVPPVSAIVANFNPATKERPSLLDHQEVETLFHEFGHIMHQVLTRARYAFFSGTNVKTDFVEAPSQMFENWVWQPEILTKLSGHFSDAKKKLPEEWIKRMIGAKLFLSGLKYLRQVGFATIDLTYHGPQPVDPLEVFRDIASNVMLIPLSSQSTPHAGFGHLMGGYDAGYYGYLWSEVFAQDMYDRFEKEGLWNSQTGREYVQWILEPGGEKEPDVLLSGFLGRHPSDEPFLKSLGIS